MGDISVNIQINEPLLETKMTETMYAIDPPMKAMVMVEKTFPGAYL